MIAIHSLTQLVRDTLQTEAKEGEGVQKSERERERESRVTLIVTLDKTGNTADAGRRRKSKKKIHCINYSKGKGRAETQLLT